MSGASAVSSRVAACRGAIRASTRGAREFDGTRRRDARQARMIVTQASAAPSVSEEHERWTYLQRLKITNFALVSEQTVEFERGLNVITGKSGSGKSVLLDAIAQICGSPAKEESIRADTSGAKLEATFHVATESLGMIYDVVNDQITSIASKDGKSVKPFGPDKEDKNALKISRELQYVDSNGKTKRIRSVCRINGRVVPLKALKALGDILMDFNGQGAASTLSDEGAQLALLDEWAGTKVLRQKFERLSDDLTAQFNKVKNAVELLPGEREELQAELEEYYAVDPEPLEDVALKAELRRLESSRVAVEMCGTVISTIAGEQGARGLLREAAHEVKGLIASAERRAESAAASARADGDEDAEAEPGLDEASIQGLNAALDLLYQAEKIAEEAEENVGKYAESLASSPRRREEAQARLRELERLFKALRVRSADAAIEAAQEAEQRLEAAEIGEEEREENVAELARLRRAASDCAFQLALQRREAAGALRGAVTSALADLEMAGSRFDVTLAWSPREGASEETNGNVLRIPRANEIGEDDKFVYTMRSTGLDRATFLLAAGQNEPLRPMGSIASGGEKARLMLALKMAPVMTNEPPSQNRGLVGGGVSVFDEVDSGVGGRVGARIGHALRRLTTTGSQQVLCVTHLPQVAACGDAHLIVSKAPDVDGRTTIDIRRIHERDRRVEEISQMLGIGDVQGRESAERLVDEAIAAFN
ncbi:DNA repair protein recN [Ostreococcus tauri]|uniref:DNA repair protein RecN n=1 Tax=Ostreococcus tauri TaxID=70448 RepID=A0A1Y5I3H0_OSTTA|nr:DNA repair protein recN [Ostreococcus tauri]